MAHDHHHTAAGLGEGDQIQGAAAKLAGAAGHGIHIGAVHQLDGVDHQHGGLHAAGLLKQSSEVGFTQHPKVRVAGGRIAAVQPLGAQSHLMRAFLAAGVQHIGAAIGQRSERLQQKRAFADAGVATKQHRAARHEATTQHAIEFLHASWNARHARGLHLAKRFGACRRRDAGGGIITKIQRAWRSLGLDELFQRIPGTAIGALAHPLWVHRAALAAQELGSCLGHGNDSTSGP